MLAALKLRVSMSVLNFSYQPEYAAASESIWRPLGDAFGDFVPCFARTLADIVRFIAAILPVAYLRRAGDSGPDDGFPLAWRAQPESRDPAPAAVKNPGRRPIRPQLLALDWPQTVV